MSYVQSKLFLAGLSSLYSYSVFGSEKKISSIQMLIFTHINCLMKHCKIVRKIHHVRHKKLLTHIHHGNEKINGILFTCQKNYLCWQVESYKAALKYHDIFLPLYPLPS